jgi:hypothetical protein
MQDDHIQTEMTYCIAFPEVVESALKVEIHFFLCLGTRGKNVFLEVTSNIDKT